MSIDIKNGQLFNSTNIDFFARKHVIYTNINHYSAYYGFIEFINNFLLIMINKELLDS